MREIVAKPIFQWIFPNFDPVLHMLGNHRNRQRRHVYQSEGIYQFLERLPLYCLVGVVSQRFWQINGKFVGPQFSCMRSEVVKGHSKLSASDPVPRDLEVWPNTILTAAVVFRPTWSLMRFGDNWITPRIRGKHDACHAWSRCTSCYRV